MLRAPRIMRSSFAIACLGTALLGACMDDKGPEDELPLEGKDDSFRRPTAHGFLEFGAQGAASALTDTERYHTWVFELTDTATVDVKTSYALLGQRRTDTVLYMYKEDYDGWGSYFARNDDYGSTTYSRLTRTLEPGRYRVLVKGHADTTRGKFKVTAACNGPGCAPGCLFGTTYSELRTSPALQQLGDYDITAANLDTLSTEAKDMLVRAVHESSHTDVTTAAEALSRVDQEEMNVTYYVEPNARRTFIAFEYGAGDNSCGAVFEKQTGARATSIHDGDLYNCEVKRETCSLPSDYPTLKEDPAFTRTALRSVSNVSQLSAAEKAQAELALRRAYGDPQLTLVDGIAMTDDGSIDVATYVHAATGRAVTVMQWYAGDTSVGALFHGATTTLAGVIDDSSIDGCSLFEPR